jgi:iron complex transport system substrate-binding protein
VLATKPDIEARIPSAGSGTDVNIEALLKLKPDVVLTWTYKPESVRFMEQKGLNVIAVYPDTLAEMFSLLELQGRLFGHEKDALRTAQSMNQVFDLVRGRAARLPAARRKKVLWIGSRQNGVAGSGGLTHELIRMLGAQNVAGGIAQRNADVSVETIVSWNPDVIFIWGNAKYGVNDILTNPQWRFIKAVREKRVFKAPEWSTWSPRLGPIVLWMASRTYPELYTDIDVHAIADRFCRDVFGVPLTKVGLNDF